MYPRYFSARADRNQSGFTVVEIMVAMLIGLFLLGGLMTLVQDNRRTFASQNQLSQLQDAERVAMTMITDVIQTAGYFPDPTTNTATSSLPVAGSLTAGQYLVGTFNAAAPGDTMTVRYATTTGDGILNCIGGSNTSGSASPLLYTAVFSVANGQLICNLNGTNYQLAGTVPISVTNASLNNGIVINKLTILYGVNVAGNDNSVTSYQTAAAVANWSNVISVQVTLQFLNPLYNASAPGAPQPQYLNFQRVIGVMNQTGI
ncbi:MAG TPA: PilW family protein [Steroidobacteraceae bacterium]|jgi:type IV pilus assembly protein PilW|nr:PilW family protein [Steroidobacteraceae bacterium]